MDLIGKSKLSKLDRKKIDLNSILKDGKQHCMFTVFMYIVYFSHTEMLFLMSHFLSTIFCLHLGMAIYRNTIIKGFRITCQYAYFYHISSTAKNFSNPLLLTDYFQFSLLTIKLNSIVMFIKNHFDIIIYVWAISSFFPLVLYFLVETILNCFNNGIFIPKQLTSIFSLKHAPWLLAQTFLMFFKGLNNFTIGIIIFRRK